MKLRVQWYRHVLYMDDNRFPVRANKIKILNKLQVARPREEDVQKKILERYNRSNCRKMGKTENT
jgi:hypothetical protein